MYFELVCASPDCSSAYIALKMLFMAILVLRVHP